MNCNRIPGIKKIQVIKCYDLPRNIMLKSLAGITVTIVAPSTNIKFVGEPKLSWENSISGSRSQESATLEFSTTEPIAEEQQMAFVVSAINGKQYIIGAREPKFPIIKYSDTTGTTSSASVRTYKITHVATKSVIECLL